MTSEAYRFRCQKHMKTIDYQRRTDDIKSSWKRKDASARKWGLERRLWEPLLYQAEAWRPLFLRRINSAIHTMFVNLFPSFAVERVEAFLEFRGSAAGVVILVVPGNLTFLWSVRQALDAWPARIASSTKLTQLQWKHRMWDSRCLHFMQIGLGAHLGAIRNINCLPLDAVYNSKRNWHKIQTNFPLKSQATARVRTRDTKTNLLQTVSKMQSGPLEGRNWQLRVSLKSSVDASKREYFTWISTGKIFQHKRLCFSVEESKRNRQWRFSTCILAKKFHFCIKFHFTCLTSNVKLTLQMNLESNAVQHVCFVSLWKQRTLVGLLEYSTGDWIAYSCTMFSKEIKPIK